MPPVAREIFENAADSLLKCALREHDRAEEWRRWSIFGLAYFLLDTCYHMLRYYLSRGGK